MLTRSFPTAMARLLAACVFVFLLGISQLPAQQAAAPAQAQTAPATAAGSFHEELIAEIPSGNQFEVWSSDGEGHHVAWIEKKGGNWTVKLDGKQQGGQFDWAEFLRLSPDGAHLHFFGKRKGKWIHVLDGNETSPGYEIPTTVSLQPGGNSYAYGGCEVKKKCHLVVDGKALPEEYEQISFPKYSSDGKRLAYFGLRHKKWIAIVDGKETGPELEDFASRFWGFSSHTGRFYAAVSQGHFKWTYFVDDAPGQEFDVMSPIVFSKDDKHYAYAGTGVQGGFKKQRTHGTIVLDGQSGTSYEGSGLPGSWTMLLGAPTDAAAIGPRNLDPNFHGVSNPWFNSEGKVAYAARGDKGDVYVTDGKRDGPPFDNIVSGIVFSDDSAHFAYVGRRGSDFVEVRDNKPGKTFPIDARLGWVDWIVLAKDGSRVAYQLVRGGGQFMVGGTMKARRTVVLDGEPGKEYNAEGVSSLLFTPDHRHFTYPVIRIEGKRDLVVVDGAESKSYDDVDGLTYNADHTAVTFFARDSSRILRVTYALQ